MFKSQELMLSLGSRSRRRSTSAVSTNIESETLDIRPVEEARVISDDDLLKAVLTPAPRWPLVAAGTIAVIVAVVAFYHALRGGVVFGPWQGAYLDLAYPYRAPLISTWVARAFVAIPVADRAYCTVLASLCTGALACGLLAAITAQALRGRMPPTATALCGAAAGSMLALTPLWARLSTGASPAPVTLLLALIGIAFLQHANYATAPRWLLYSGLCMGLAAANDPSFAIVFVIALLAALGELGEHVRVTKIFTPMLAGVGVAICVPLVRAFWAGESLAEFLSHAMGTTFPAIGDGAPQFAFGLELRPQFSWPVLGAALIGLTALFMRNMRGPAVTWALIFLAMGPFWPALTNQHASPYVLRDTDAPAAIAYAAACVCAGWGIAWTVHALANGPRRGPWAAGLAGCAALALAGEQYRAAFPPRAASAEYIGGEIFNECAPGAALLVGDSHTASLLRTLQLAHDVRPDVAVISVHALEQPKWRAYLHRKFAGVLSIAGDFPPVEAWKRWPLERPNEFAMLNVRLKQGGIRESDFRDLMLWEFMRDNFKNRPICFAGVSSPWLTARGKRTGVVLQYPRAVPGSGRSLDAIGAMAHDNSAIRADAEFDKTAVGLLLPLAEACRRQDDVAESERLAALARDFGANDAGAWLTSARAAARGGQRERAIDYATNYIRLAKSEQDMQVFLDLIEEDLRRNSVATEFGSDRVMLDGSESGIKRRADLATQLWDLDELAVLSNAYSRAIASGSGDFETLYEGAAADVQLGELGAARERLGRAAAIDPFKVWSRLQIDGRFLLLEADSHDPVPGIPNPKPL